MKTKYKKPQALMIELKENITCSCGSNCQCDDRWWRNKCDCKDPWWWPFDSTTDKEDSPQETNNVWNNEW